MTTDFQVDTRELQGLFRDLEELSGKKAGVLIRERAGLLARVCAERTQPVADASSGDAVSSGTTSADGASPKARQLGEQAVRRDIGRVYVPGNRVFGEIERRIGTRAARAFKKLLKTNPEEAWRLLQSAGLAASNLGVSPWDGGTLHQQLRNRGRINRGNKPVIIPDTKQLVDYVKKAIKRVGYTKSGWITAARQIPGAKGISRVAAWIKRHTAPGAGIDRTRGAQDPQIQLINRVPWIDRNFSTRQETKAFEAFDTLLAKDLRAAIAHLKQKRNV